MIISLLLVTVLVLIPAATSQAAVQISLAPGIDPQLVVSGMTPGGEAVWFSVSRDRSRPTTSVIRQQGMVHDQNGDGQIEIDLSRQIAPQSIWFVVDVATGEHQTVAPEGFAYQEFTAPVSISPLGPTQQTPTLQVPHRFIDLLVVRNTGEAWVMSCGDGGEHDDDGLLNGSISADWSRMTPLGEANELTSLVPGDVVIGVNPESLGYFAEKIS